MVVQWFSTSLGRTSILDKIRLGKLDSNNDHKGNLSVRVSKI